MACHEGGRAMPKRPYHVRISSASPISRLFSLFSHSQGQYRNQNFQFSVLLLFLFGFVIGCAAPLANPTGPNSSLVVGRVVINNKYPGPSGAGGTLHIGTIEELIDVEIVSEDGSKILEATTGEGGYFFSANIPPGLYYLNKVTMRGEAPLLRETVTLKLGKRHFFVVPSSAGEIVEAGTYHLEVAERFDLKLKHEQFDPGTVKLFLMNKYPNSLWLKKLAGEQATTEMSTPTQQRRANMPSVEISEKDGERIVKANLKKQMEEEGEVASLDTRDFRFNDYFAHLRRKIREAWDPRASKYPGEVKLKFVLRDDGSLRRVELVSSSGHDILDKVAISAVSDPKFDPFPPALRSKRKFLPITAIFSYAVR